ncbi:hypothetical protein BJ138DRAFT_757359 [Hygrophoropsis aurantiaca]|uniref:Uncharacterized protein n=1 Tax=Hygrophoropsis aurantiaca TaxID=72124 RepID=A0ACB8AIA1_9AGAM|nr:hypothetical protein BJ138DRAFT_757359 [Hygrophoropsis aurantiaca]
MFINKVLPLCCAVFAGVSTVHAAAAATPTSNCPVTSVITSTYTGLIEAPGTTYPYTTTVTLTEVSIPPSTTTITGTWTYEGTTSTYTETETYTNYYGPWPGC